MSAETLRSTRYRMDNWLPEVPTWETRIITPSTIPQTSDPRPATQDPPEMQTSDPGPAAAASKQGQDSYKKTQALRMNCYSAARTPNTTRPSGFPCHLRALLRRVFFIKAGKCRYVFFGFYPAHDYQVLVEFGGSRSHSITLTTQHANTPAEHLPELYDAVYLGIRYRYKDGEFKLQCSGTDSVARLYLNKRFITFKDCDIRYLICMLYIVHPSKHNIQSPAMMWRMSSPRHQASLSNLSAFCGLILYDQLFQEIKTLLI
jgi:hypothetical protein